MVTSVCYAVAVDHCVVAAPALSPLARNLLKALGIFQTAEALSRGRWR